jgi:hypothetical protein
MPDPNFNNFQKFFVILLIAFAAHFSLNCGSAQPKVEKEIIPDVRIGCQEFKGAQRMQCIQHLIQELEYIRNPNKQIERTVTESRHDETWVQVSTKFCVTRELCWTEVRYEYRPSFIEKIKSTGAKIGIGILIGLAVGL